MIQNRWKPNTSSFSLSRNVSSRDMLIRFRSLQSCPSNLFPHCFKPGEGRKYRNYGDSCSLIGLDIKIEELRAVGVDAEGGVKNEWGQDDDEDGEEDGQRLSSDGVEDETDTGVNVGG